MQIDATARRRGSPVHRIGVAGRGGLPVATGMIFDTTWDESPSTSPLPPVDAGPFIVRETRYPEAPAAGVCSARRMTIVVVLSGILRFHDGPSIVAVRPRRALVLPAGAPHRGLAGGRRCRCLTIEFDRERLEPDALPSESLRHVAVVASPRMVTLALALRRDLGDAERNGLTLRTEGLARELVATAVREYPPARDETPEWLVHVRKLIDAGSPEPLTMAELAAAVHVSEREVERGFIQYYGQPIGGYIRRRRIGWAADALVASADPIAQIAAAAGFFDQSHFTRAFKRVFGTTPAEQRRTGATGAGEGPHGARREREPAWRGAGADPAA